METTEQREFENDIPQNFWESVVCLLALGCGADQLHESKRTDFDQPLSGRSSDPAARPGQELPHASSSELLRSLYSWRLRTLPDWTWVILIPVAAITLTVWHRSLLTAFPAILACYATFLVALFKLEWSIVGVAWLLFAVVTVPVLWLKFPGQYNVKRSTSALGFWPILITFALLAEDVESDGSIPERVPGQISGKISFIESAGTEPNYLLIFIEEFGNTAFFCPMDAETEPGVHEDANIQAHVEYRSFPDLTKGDVLWLSEIRLKP